MATVHIASDMIRFCETGCASQLMVFQRESFYEIDYDTQFTLCESIGRIVFNFVKFQLKN